MTMLYKIWKAGSFAQKPNILTYTTSDSLYKDLPAWLAADLPKSDYTVFGGYFPPRHHQLGHNNALIH